MAANALRLRRSLALTSSILNHPKHFSSVLPSVAASPSSPSIVQQNPSSFDVNQSKPNSLSYQFISSRSISSRVVRYDNDMDGDQIGPDAILFEGCDYNHWLITIDFPKDPKPSPEEMVETYVQTAAKVLGSVEEAKKKIYACSTTTYQGFQVEVSEQVSEQFKGLPGVVFVLPDSYIDPVNKEYGGDKYINGTIIPRPPPVQYGRQGGRYNDRNRDYNRPPRGQIEQNGRPGIGLGNYQGDRRVPMPSYQANYNQGDGRNTIPARQTDSPQRDQGNFAPPPPVAGGGGNFRQGTEGQYSQGGGGGGGYGGQPGGGNFRQGTGGQYGQGGGGGGHYSQGGGGQFGQGGGGGGQYGQGGGGKFGQGGGGGGQYGQGGGGKFGQGGGGGGQYGQGGGGSYGQGGGGSYGQAGSGGGNYVQGGGGGGGGYGQGGGGGQYGQGGGGGQYGQGGGGQYGQGGYGQGNGSGSNQRSSQYEVVEEVEAFKGR